MDGLLPLVHKQMIGVVPAYEVLSPPYNGCENLGFVCSEVEFPQSIGWARRVKIRMGEEFFLSIEDISRSSLQCCR